MIRCTITVESNISVKILPRRSGVRYICSFIVLNRYCKLGLKWNFGLSELAPFPASECVPVEPKEGWEGGRREFERLERRPEYVILDDFLSFYSGYTRALPGVLQWPRIFHILDKFAITWCNCILPGVLANTWGRKIHWLEPVFISIPGVQII